MYETVAAFAALCQQIAEHSEFTVKEDVVKGFLAKYGGDKVLLFRLLLPKLADRKYFLADKQLVKICAPILGCAEEDLQDRINKSGDIAATVSDWFGETLLCKHKCSTDITLKDLDARLEGLSKLTAEEDQQKCIRDFMALACPADLCIFLRLVKQDLRLNAGVKCILNGLDPEAYDMYKTCGEIPRVVRALTGEGGGEDDEDAAGSASPGSPAAHAATRLGPGAPVLPMLARPAKSIEDVIKRCPNTSYSEIKYDGERIQIHKGADGKLSYWARSLRPMKEDKYEGLGAHIREAIRADTCILDGEILLVDNATGRPLPFGTLGKHRKTEFKEASTCIFLFDILFLNGESLIKEPLEARRALLCEHVAVERNRVMVSQLQPIRGSPKEQDAQLRHHLRYAIVEGLEGLVVKDVRSCYEPNARHWIKVKRDYLSGMADTADLVVLGGYFGSGSKGGIMSTFLMGCLDRAASAQGTAPRWKTVSRVANGHDDATLAKVNAELRPQMEEIRRKPAACPRWLHCHNSHLPDLVVKDPTKAPVWEVMGAELTVSKTHTADGICFRFPRVVRIRDDKTWESATDLAQLRRIHEASKSLAKDARLMDLGVMERTLAAEAQRRESLDADDWGPDAAPAPAGPPAAAAPPAAADKATAGAADAAAGAVTYVVGNASHPVSTSHAVRIIAHCVSEGGRWSGRGTMGRISLSLGSEPQEEYNAASKASALALGDAQIVPMSDPYATAGRLLVASLVCHRPADPSARVMPPFDLAAFESALQRTLERARSEEASVHLAIVSGGRGKGKLWAGADTSLRRLAAAAGVPVWVYTPAAAEADHYNAARSRVPQPPRVCPPPPAPAPAAPAAGERKGSSSAAFLQAAAPLQHCGSTVDLGTDAAPSPAAAPPAAAPAAPVRQPTMQMGRAETAHFFDELGGLFAGARFAVSGYAPREAKALAQKIKMMGGEVQPRWVSFGGSQTDLLVCETLTDEHERVVSLGGTVVTRRYVGDCFSQCRRLVPAGDYLFDPAADPAAAPPAPPSTASAPPAPEPKRFRAASPAAAPSPGAGAAAGGGGLANVFSGCTVLLHGAEGDQPAAEELERYIIAYDGDVADPDDVAGATHVVACGVAGLELRALLGCAPSTLHCVKPQWVWDSVKRKKRAAEGPYRVAL
eukprot:TRINITY_DN5036_c1_g1_i7.p1 TRINITY_DN5036_c1_g1~~TRINITY_DN5036_c1_g1_i7.p1  ORF type:complete len:1159 (+),score=375.54 TRINITY_DN5036_c1_g1_i7:75-3551(+)